MAKTASVEPVPAGNLLTAAAIADALGRTPQAVKARLAHVPCAGKVTVRGQEAKAWSWAELPEGLRQELSEMAARRGCRTVLQLFDTPPARWQPSVAFADLPQHVQDKANRLRDALAGIMAGQEGLSRAELLDRARTAYRQAFGHEIEDSKLDYVLGRATERDNGFGRWQNPLLYLADADFARPAAPPDLKKIHEPLQVHIATLENRARPTLADRKFIFHAAFKHLESLYSSYQSTSDRREIKASLLSYLLESLPALHAARTAKEGTPLDAMRRLFNRTYAVWIEGGRLADSIEDERQWKCGMKTRAFPTDERKIRDQAAHFRGTGGKKGNVTEALRVLAVQGELSKDFVAYWKIDPKRKQIRIQRSLMARITPNEITIAKVKGKRAYDLSGPYIPRDWGSVLAGDWFSMDDMTSNDYAWDEISLDGSNQIIHGPVQLLAVHDLRTSYWLDFFAYFGQPTGRHIRKSLYQVFVNSVGLPRVGLLLERGVFACRYVIGEKDAKDWLKFRETEAGLEQLFRLVDSAQCPATHDSRPELGLGEPALDLQIKHATRPCGKPIEGDFLTLQRRSSMLDGFGGFNQRLDAREGFQEQKALVEAGKAHPMEFGWLRLSDWAANHRAFMEELNQRPKFGVRHKGASPLQLWTADVNRHPLRKLPTEMEYLLATHRRKVSLNEKGIQIPLSAYEKAVYWGPELGDLLARGVREVEAYINLDFPDHLTIEHRGARLLVQRRLLPAMAASKEELSDAQRARREFMRRGCGQYGKLTHPLQHTIIRDNNYSDADKERGREILERTEQAKAEQTAKKRKVGAIQNAARALGGSVPTDIRNPDRVREGLDWEAKVRERLQSRGKQSHRVEEENEA